MLINCQNARFVVETLHGAPRALQDHEFIGRIEMEDVDILLLGPNEKPPGFDNISYTQERMCYENLPQSILPLCC